MTTGVNLVLFGILVKTEIALYVGPDHEARSYYSSCSSGEPPSEPHFYDMAGRAEQIEKITINLLYDKISEWKRSVKEST